MGEPPKIHSEFLKKQDGNSPKIAKIVESLLGRLDQQLNPIVNPADQGHDYDDIDKIRDVLGADQNDFLPIEHHDAKVLLSSGVVVLLSARGACNFNFRVDAGQLSRLGHSRRSRR
jgi:hypothetical protein